MSITAAIICAVVYAVINWLDPYTLSWQCLNRPIVVAPLVGLLLGDFQTGIIDATQMDASALVSMQLYSDAPYWMYDNTYAAGNFITVNLAWWNGLTEAQQTVVQQAANATAQFSLGLLQTSMDTDRATLADAGATVIDIDDEGFSVWYDVIAQTAFRDGMARGEIAGTTDSIQAVIDEVCALTGLTYEG